jgi:hypothetical protein
MMTGDGRNAGKLVDGHEDVQAVEEAERIETQANTNAASRAIAVMILMILPGIAGSYLDKWLGTQFFVILGFVVGIVVAIFGLLYVAKIADVAAKKSRDLRREQAGSRSTMDDESTGSPVSRSTVSGSDTDDHG